MILSVGVLDRVRVRVKVGHVYFQMVVPPGF